MAKLYVVVAEGAWETDKHNVESCFQEVRQGHEEKVSRLFGEDEWAPQQHNALGSSAVCGRTETKNSTGPILNLLFFNWTQFSVQILERIDNDSFHVCLPDKRVKWNLLKYLDWNPWLIHV